MNTNLKLLEPYPLGPYTLKNRMVMAPLTRNRAAVGNVPQPINVDYYKQRVSAGLIVTEASQISPQGQGYLSTPGIHSPEQVEGWKLITKAVHENAGLIFQQLWHVGRISHPSLQPNGELPVAPSAIAPEGNASTLSGLHVETELFRENNAPGSEGEQRYINMVPIGRLGQPAEIAAAIAFFCSHQAAFITGQTLFVDGGASIGCSFV